MFISYSCEQEEVTKQREGLVRLIKVKDTRIISSIKSSLTSRARVDEDHYDWESMSIVEMNDSEISTSIPTYVVAAADNESERLGVYDNGEELAVIKVRTNQISENQGEISYYTLNDQLISTVFVDGNSKEFQIIKNSNPNIRNDDYDCGQATADCIAEVYTDRGWWSVGAAVASYLSPGVGVGIASLCALEMCAGDGQV